MRRDLMQQTITNRHTMAVKEVAEEEVTRQVETQIHIILVTQTDSIHQATCIFLQSQHIFHQPAIKEESEYQTQLNIQLIFNLIVNSL